MGKHEIFVNLMNLIGSIEGAVTFMPMVSNAKGLMTTECVEYTAEEMEKLMHLAEENNVSVRFVPLPVSKGRLKCVCDEVRIGIRMGMSFDEYVYTLHMSWHIITCIMIRGTLLPATDTKSMRNRQTGRLKCFWRHCR